MSNPQIQVLIVEDDEVNAQAARTMLERLGCRVDTASNGVEAIELFEVERYDLILMDWQMPRMDGVEATARIRGMRRGHATPIVGTTSSRSRQECLAAGMNDLMPKPFLQKKLQQELLKWTSWGQSLEAASE
jgi:two-component system, sensor histidine kinase and response regulator